MVFESLSFRLVSPEFQALSLSSSLASPLEASLDDKASQILHRQKTLQWLCENAYSLVGSKATCSTFREFEGCKEGVRLYSSMQTLMKMHPLFDTAMGEILLRDPCAVIILTRNLKQFDWQRRFRLRLHEQLIELGAGNHRDRIVFVDQLPHRHYSKLLCAVDVALDSFPFGGGVTMCDSVAGGCTPMLASAPLEAPEDVIECAKDPRRRCSVPFITVGDLQTVHRIGSGIAAKLNNSDLARVVRCPRQDPFTNASFSGALSSMSAFHRSCIARFAAAAVELAIESNARRFGADEAMEEDLVHDPFGIIYGGDEVQLEWDRFLRRAVDQ